MYKLNFKQSVDFEIMSYSFILKSLKVQNITEDILHQFFKENKDQQNKYIDCMKEFNKKYQR